MPDKKKLTMKSNLILLGAAIVTFSSPVFAGTGANLLRAPIANSLNSLTGTPAITTVYVVSPAVLTSPRALANQSRIIQGVASSQYTTLDCRNNMSTSPKAVAECVSHSAMPGCITVATAK